MLFDIPLAYAESLQQFAALLRDPFYRHPDGLSGQGEPVLLIPGFLGGDWMLLTLAGWLRRLGYRPYLSGIYVNIRNPLRTGEQLGWRVEHIVQRTGSPLIIVGHSLGGMLARYLGSRFPQYVRHVVTVGSPLQDALGTTHPLVASLFRLTQATQQRLKAVYPAIRPPQLPWDFFERVAAPLPDGVGFTTIFSKQDEVVDWHGCLDPYGENLEVPGRHVSMMVNRAVYHALARTFANLAYNEEATWKDSQARRLL